MDALELNFLLRDLATLRDLAIIVFTSLSVLALLVILFLTFRVYRKISSILGAGQRITKVLEDAATARNVGRVAGFILGLTRRKRGK